MVVEIRYPRELSGGQRQRVAIGRAIVRNPKAFLFDEPLSNLDAALRGDMRLQIAQLHKDLVATMIYVTHDQTEAMTLADQIVVLNPGTIEQLGPPHVLYGEPTNLFVARFIGNPRINLISVESLRSDSRPELFDLGKAATVGIRPEHIAVVPSGSSEVGGGFHLVGTLKNLEYFGADTIAFFDCGLEELLDVRLPGRALHERGGCDRAALNRLRVCLGRPGGRQFVISVQEVRDTLRTIAKSWFCRIPRIFVPAAFLSPFLCRHNGGGSTNALSHLQAIARHVGVELQFREWQNHGCDLPLLVNMQSAGLLHEDALTASGKSMKERLTLRAVLIAMLYVRFLIRCGKRLASWIVSGNLFDSTLMKTSVISGDFRARFLSRAGREGVFEARAIVFEDPEDVSRTDQRPRSHSGRELHAVHPKCRVCWLSRIGGAC